MTVTYSIDHCPTTTESVNVEVAPKSEFALIRTYTDNTSGELVSEYRLASGDELYPATVAYRYGIQTRKTGNVRRISVTFYTWATKTDSVAGTVEYEPINSTIQFILPAQMTIEVADLDDFLGNTLSFMYGSVSAGARSTGYLQALLYGRTQVV